MAETFRGNTKISLKPCPFIGPRDADAAYAFLHDLAARLATRVQLTSDARTAYHDTVVHAF